MKTTRLIAAALLAGVVALSGCDRDAPVEPVASAAPPGALETPPPMDEPEAPAANVRVTEVQLGLEAADDRTIAEPKTRFAAADGLIIAAIHTSNEDPGEYVGVLSARWTYQDGQLVEDSSETLAFRGQDVTNFHIENPDDWPAGTYTVEISLDGEVLETREFTIE